MSKRIFLAVGALCLCSAAQASEVAGLVSLEWRPGSAHGRGVWDLQLAAAVDAGPQRAWQPVTGVGYSPRLGAGMRLFGAPLPPPMQRVNADGEVSSARIPWWAWAAGGVAVTVALAGGDSNFNPDRDDRDDEGSTQCGISGSVVGSEPMTINTDCPPG